MEMTDGLFRAIMRNIHAYVLLINRDFTVFYTNYYDIVGVPKPSITQRVGDLLRCNNAMSSTKGCGTHELCGQCPVRRTIENTFLTKQCFTDLDAILNIRGAQDRVAECEAHISGEFMQIEGKDCMVITVHDITHLKQVEMELKEARKKAEQADYSKSVFLANMSHEIRTPLNAIVGFSQLLPTADTPEEQKLYSDIINQNSDILLQLINDILDLSKIEAGTLEYVKRPINLGEVCRTIYAVHKERIKGGVDFIFDNGEEDLQMEGDPNRIMQIITNFITNATKFTHTGEIRFGFEREGENVRVYVKDTGIGIEKEKVGHIFERFVKLNSFVQGTGLGLSICRMIIEKIGGEIGVTSEFGKGSTFYFIIPCTEVD